MKSRFGRILMSPSEIATADRCGAWHRFKYIDKVPPDFRPSKLPFLAGCFSHAYLEERYKREARASAEVWEEIWPQVRTKLPEDEAYSRVLSLAEEVHRLVQERYAAILFVEEEVNFPLAGNLTLHGYPDLVGRLPDGSVEVMDLKVSGQKATVDTVRKHLKQVATYVGAVHDATKAVILAGRVSEALKPRGPLVSAEFFPVPVTPDDLALLEEDAHALLEQVQLGTHRYTGLINGVCSYCPYTSKCAAQGRSENALGKAA